MKKLYCKYCGSEMFLSSEAKLSYDVNSGHAYYVHYYTCKRWSKMNWLMRILNYSQHMVHYDHMGHWEDAGSNARKT